MGRGLKHLVTQDAWAVRDTGVDLVRELSGQRSFRFSSRPGQALDVQVKAALVRHQSFAGVLSEAGKLVENLTGQTSAPAL